MPPAALLIRSPEFIASNGGIRYMALGWRASRAANRATRCTRGTSNAGSATAATDPLRGSDLRVPEASGEAWITVCLHDHPPMDEGRWIMDRSAFSPACHPSTKSTAKEVVWRRFRSTAPSTIGLRGRKYKCTCWSMSARCNRRRLSASLKKFKIRMQVRVRVFRAGDDRYIELHGKPRSRSTATSTASFGLPGKTRLAETA